ncbi:MAG TPA: hypothetical protein VIF12_04245 [Micavibrio sp.]|jgi:hypothetical protein
MMIFKPASLAIAVMMILAALPARSQTMTCMVPKAPLVDIKVSTNPVEYDFSKSAAALGGVKTDTISPYAPGADTVSGGLREDHPTVRTEIGWEIQYDQRRGVACMWYDTIKIKIMLDPKIYVAREFNSGACREAILQHERRHVDVDHIVINKYAGNMGNAVRDAVDSAGAIGPFSYGDLENMKTVSSRHIESAVDSQQLLMQKEMRQLQGQVDSLAEYQKISAQCQGLGVR